MSRGEGLGLGHIDMPGSEAHRELGPTESPRMSVGFTVSSAGLTTWTTARPPQCDNTDRYQTLKSRITRHKPSNSSPSSLAPFSEQLITTQDQPATVRYSGQSRKGSFINSVSYPTLVSRNDVTLASVDSSAFIPLRPAPPPNSDAAHEAISDRHCDLDAIVRSRSASSPTIKAGASRDFKDSFLGPFVRDRPFISRFGSSEKNKIAERDCSDSKRGETSSPSRSKTPRIATGISERRISPHDYDESDIVSITLARAHEMQESFEARIRKDSGYGSMSGPSGVSCFKALPSDTFIQTRKTSIGPRQHMHRRANSDGMPDHSPDVECLRSKTPFGSSRPGRPQTTYSRSAEDVLRRPLASSLAKAQDTGGRSSNSLPSSRAPLSPTSSRRPSFVPKPLDESDSVGISVRATHDVEREVARAPLNADGGATVFLRSYNRPEDLQVGWTCTSGVDTLGRSWTQWAVTLCPRRTSMESVPARPAPRKGMSFSTYRLAPLDTYGPTNRSDEAISPAREEPSTTTHSGASVDGAFAQVREQNSSDMAPSSSPRRPSMAHVVPLTVPILSKPPALRRKGSASSGSSSGSSISTGRRQSVSQIATATRVRYLPRGSKDDPETPTKSAARGGGLISPTRTSSRASSLTSPTRATHGVSISAPPAYRLSTIPPTPAEESQPCFPDADCTCSEASREDVHTPHHDDGDEDIFAARQQTESALIRGQRLVTSRWSDTEDDKSDDDIESLSRPKTSWSDVDGLEEDLIVVSELR